jgi:hypothetical protein
MNPLGSGQGDGSSSGAGGWGATAGSGGGGGAGLSLAKRRVLDAHGQRLKDVLKALVSIAANLTAVSAPKSKTNVQPKPQPKSCACARRVKVCLSLLSPLATDTHHLTYS